MIADDEKYMLRCFKLAFRGLGYTHSNPIVGAVIVVGGRIIGEGFHYEYGGPHAEVNAIRSVKDKSLLKQATIYINLEPCSHFGKTPPCSELIIKAGIPRAVIANVDPFPSVSGKGIEALQKAGLDVTTGVLEEEGAFVNRRFLTYQQLKRPYIVLKWAETADGFIDLLRTEGTPVGPNWITDEVAQTLVHKWRSEEAGLMVGTNTIITDNPQLNVRRWSGKNPLRITFDRDGRIPRDSAILDNSQHTLVFTCNSDNYTGKIKSVLIDHDYSLEEVFQELYNRKLISVMVEGGKEILQTLIDKGLWDEARVFVGNRKFNEGVKAPELNVIPVESLSFKGSELKIIYNKSKKDLKFED